MSCFQLEFENMLILLYGYIISDTNLFHYTVKCPSDHEPNCDIAQGQFGK